MSRIIKLNGDNSKILSVDLSDLLNQLINPKMLEWKILWIEVIGNSYPVNLLELESLVNESVSGYLIDWMSLQKLSKQLYQVIEIMLIGDEDINNLKRYEDIKKMRSTCSICIELIDSSYWEISGRHLDTIFGVPPYSFGASEEEE